jgi:SepF-like predicted cell division protein (DUF552 family)
MSGNNRTQTVLIRISEAERKLIQKKMALIGSQNMSAYLRRMAIDGYIINLDLSELREMVSLLRRISNTLNQIAKRVNSTSRIYDDDIEEIKRKLEEIWTQVNQILLRFSELS